jgi:PAS domain S-box-containing protein
VKTLIRDITEPNYAEEALKESEAKYRALVERAQDGIVIVQENRIMFANPSMAALLGYTVEELRETLLSEHMAAEERPRIEDRYRRRTGQHPAKSIVESIMRSKEGRELAVEFNVGFITYQGRSADLVIVRDIRARKESEKALQEYQQRLKALALELTIAEEQERRRIAANWHDLIRHPLVLVCVQLKQVMEARSQLETKVLINDISNCILKAMQDAKNGIFELSSPFRMGVGLLATIAELLEERVR